VGSPLCSACGAPLTAGGTLCVRCGTQNPGPPPRATGPSPSLPALPSPPLLGFRRPRDRGSTIVRVVILIAVLFVAVSFTSYLFYSSLACQGGCVGETSVSNGFDPGHATLAQCPGGDTFVESGCEGPSHFFYQVTLRSSSVPFGDIHFKVESSDGLTYEAPGALGFAVLSPEGIVLAWAAAVGGEMTMTSGWTYPIGLTNTSTLESTFVLSVDVGPQSPEGLGLEFVAVGSGAYQGTTAPFALP
jgi:hypothetical protein